MAVPIYNYYYSPLLRCPPCASPSSSSPPYHQLHLLSPNSLHSSSPSLYHLKNQSIISATITVFPLSRRRRRALTMDCQTTPEQKSISQERMLFCGMRIHQLQSLFYSDFVCVESAMAELGRLLMYEASRDWLPTISGEIQSPLGVATVEFIDPREPVAVVPILRAGLALAEHASSILPASKTYHLGISRNEETLQPTVYLNKLPDRFPEGSRVFVVDPMLATGGTIVAALNLIKERGVDNKQIKVVSAVAAPPALQKLSEKFPGLHVYAGNIDPTVNDKGFIIPGVGDAGDRSFGT
ncbi:uracil phosphoribosyltransferase isoform X4 [Coffea arabica]|uniref:uracil phosphoribosyltransferase n=1 Tax=Coffea arabica TaxID=13443 RepID=A0ABM4UL92_COFAR